MSSRLKKAIGAVKDQTSISLAKVASNTTSHLEVAVLKATTHDDLPIDERYVYEVLQLVSSNKSYAAACARALGKRIGRTRNWIVALKSLMLVLRIFQDGDPYFPREILHAMKRGAKILNLSSFRDDSNSSPWDFTAFVRTFALYLDERLDCFLTGKLQRRYTHKVKETSGHRNRRPNEPVRDMKPAMLLDKISYWQRLLERAIATRPTGAAKTNRLVQTCLYAVVQESFDLYKDISDGLALLLDSFFHLQYQNCVNAFQTCVKASKLFEELSTFYSMCKSVGVGRTSEYPSIQTISEELIETLQEFLKDKSSFPATSKSPNRGVLLLTATPNSVSRSSRNDSYGGQSEFSVATTEAYSDRTSDVGSQCTSLEELISATEMAGIRPPSISIDLEDYSDQFEEELNRDKSFRQSDSGSTKSLPISSSIADLVSLDDWPEANEELGLEQNDPLSSVKGWDLVLAEEIRSQPSPVSSNFSAFQEQDQPQNLNQKKELGLEQREKSIESSSSGKGWDLVLAEMITSQPSPVPHYSNAFQEPNETQKLDELHEQGLDQQNEKSSKSSSSTKGWENVLADMIRSQPSPVPNSFNAFQEQDQPQKLNEIGPTNFQTTGWELALVGETPQQHSQPINDAVSSSTLDIFYNQNSKPTSSPAFNSSTIDGFYNQSSMPTSSAPSPYYNPFLQDTSELPPFEFQGHTNATTTTTTAEPDLQLGFPLDNGFSYASGFQTYEPTFHATPPTFSAQDPNGSSIVSQVENDPFGTVFSSDQIFSGSKNQPNLLHEQQLWLHNQNKIIAKHMT